MIGTTVAGVFDFDLDFLQTLADTVGPTVDEVNTPPDRVASVPDESLSPVFSSAAFIADR